MAKLTKSGRSAIPTGEFAGPGRSYPIENADHARAAIIDSAKGVLAGHITGAQRAEIVKRAKAKLKEK